MELQEKLAILSDAAKYDVACTSSGHKRVPSAGGVGSTVQAGICHSFSADGRCVSLLKVLLSNVCIYDCKYCVNRRSHDVPRASFEAAELADLTMSFYRRNYIEGLFLSSGIFKSPDDTCERMIEVLRLLRQEHRFEGYIHAKAIPGADPRLIQSLGMLADRVSVNIEMPSENSLRLMAPDKSRASILQPMGWIHKKITETSSERALIRHVPRFAPAGQSTQMIIGASPDNDRQILSLSQGLYQNYQLKRVFFSAYVPTNSSEQSVAQAVPVDREHRLYQADWLMRFYQFRAEEILDESQPYLSPYLDPKCHWALRHPECFPVDVKSASYSDLLRVPGIGVNSAQRIISTRRNGVLTLPLLSKIGVVMKRARYFICVGGKTDVPLRVKQSDLMRAVMSPREIRRFERDGYFLGGSRQLPLWDEALCLDAKEEPHGFLA